MADSLNCAGGPYWRRISLDLHFPRVSRKPVSAKGPGRRVLRYCLIAIWVVVGGALWGSPWYSQSATMPWLPDPRILIAFQSGPSC